MSRAEFDEFARKYETTMERPCAVSGESPDFYAVERMRWCRRRLRHWLPADTVLDFGCGIGGSTRYFFDILGCKSVIAVDPSVESLQVAKERYSVSNGTASRWGAGSSSCVAVFGGSELGHPRAVAIGSFP